MKTLIILTLFALSVAGHARRGQSKNSKPLQLNEFTTDGCSAYPDGYIHTAEYEWLHCCIAHDISYWVGGPSEEKEKADAELNSCVSEATFSSHGTMMELGVATGGTPHLATSWRWGYGWNKMVTFNGLSKNKLEMINDKAFTVLNALSLESYYLNEEQIDYVMEKYSEFRNRTLEQLNETEE